MIVIRARSLQISQQIESQNAVFLWVVDWGMLRFGLGVFAVFFGVGQGPRFFAFGDEGGEAAVGEARPKTV